MENPSILQYSKFVYGQTVLHPLALACALIAGLLIILLPRRYAIAPILAAAVFISMQQQIVVASLDFNMLRILVVFGWIRLVLRSEFQGLQLNAIDKGLIIWVVVRTVCYTLLWQTSDAFINRLGEAFDVLGIFFLIRFLIRDLQEIEYVIKTLAVICVPLAIAMLIEWSTGKNAFAVFGGVPELTVVRDDRLRCQGAFKHPIMAGTFAASLLPLFLALWRQNKEKGKGLAIIGAIAATIVTASTASSGPALTYLAGIAALCLWRARKLLPALLWATACAVLALQIFMKAPIWALLARFNVFGASTGYHRYYLFDQFIRRFQEWWLIGTKSTAKWGYFLFDITNQYVQIGVSGGLISLGLFLMVIMLCFTGLRKAIHAMEGQRGAQLYFWALGASLFSHVVSFMGVSYFDQIILVWYMLLAMIATANGLAARKIQETSALDENLASEGLSQRQFAF